MPEITLDWNKYTAVAIHAAEEGAVLLRNEDSVLPLEKGTKTAVFGRMQSNYYKSGTGSGGMVNVNHTVDILEGLVNDGSLDLDQELISVYKEWEKENPVDPGVGWGKEMWSQEDMPLDDELMKTVSARNDVAIMIIARTAGEDRDNTLEKGSFTLRDSEEAMIAKVCSFFKKTIVLLNVGNIIDMSFVTKYNPSSVMYVWQAGMIGGTAVANLVTGKAVPSGCLTDTIAFNYEDHPSSKNFGNVDPDKDFYEEDIYVGYRYFSTFAPEKVMYPFGFGLSYTTFDLKADDYSFDGNEFSVSVKVTNTGKIPGKKAVMLYASTPCGRLGKPARVLVSFAKTGILEPGSSETLTLCAERMRFASFDDDGRLGFGTGWVLEKGDYEFFLGDNVRDASPVGGFNLESDVILEKLESALAPVEPFNRMTRDGYEAVPVRTYEHVNDAAAKAGPEIPQTGDKGIKLADVKAGRNTLDEFVAQLTDEDLSLIIRGEGMSSPKVTTGTAGAFGGISKELMSYGIPTICCSDGPSGMRIDSGKKAFSIPNGTCLASTFNEALNEELFDYFGIEMVSNEIDTILGPGINIHRNPLNGRNFEYFSEDPFLTGRMASAQIRGLEKSGVTATIKHFCVNNRETRRRFMNSVVSERALREIYLKGFEIAVKEGKARSIMTVYNMVNGVYGGGNYELDTVILREQWGYTGIVMTDWWTFLTKLPDKSYKHGVTEHSMMARAQNDIYMVCSAVEKPHLEETDCYANLKAGNGEITRAELQRNAKNIIRFAMNTPAMNREEGNPITVRHIDCPFAEDTIEAKVDLYYNILETPVIDVDVDTSTGNDFVIGVTCDKPGRYSVEMTAVSDLNELAQIPMTVYYTSIPVRVFTWNGTEGREVTQSTDLLFMSKYTIFRAHFGSNGVKLKRLKFSFVCSPEDDPNIEI